LSPFYKRRVETEEEKEGKAREKIQRLHTRSFKERGLKMKESELKNKERILAQKRYQFDAANLIDDRVKVILKIAYACDEYANSRKRNE
jgi:hypothetical protein